MPLQPIKFWIGPPLTGTVPTPGTDIYFQPDGVSRYFRPDGSSLYFRPGA
jgi:hypothetical protein